MKPERKKSKKKRPNKYEEKLVVNMTFEELVKHTLKTRPPKAS